MDMYCIKTLFTCEIYQFYYPRELKMLTELFGESALKGPRLRATVNTSPALLDHACNVNYIESIYSEREEEEYYEMDVEKKYIYNLAAPGYEFIFDGYGDLRIWSRYEQVCHLFVLLSYFIITLFTNAMLLRLRSHAKVIILIFYMTTVVNRDRYRICLWR